MYRIYSLIIFFGILLISCKKPDEPIPVIPRVLEIKGAELSYLPELRASGITLYNTQNQAQDMLLSLKNAGVNVIRLRLWHQPSNPQSGFNTVKNLSLEIKNMGLKVLLTVHYSDTWADPGSQTKPAMWQNISFDLLKDSVYQYTKKIVTEMQPNYIQIGNEINNGFLWPDGHISQLNQMKVLIQEGIRAVQENNASTKIMLHYAGHQNALSFFNNLSSLNYQMAGISYYPKWHGNDLELLEQNLKSLTLAANKPICIVETSYPFSLGWNDWTHNVIGDESQILTAYAPTPAGQKAYLQKIKEITLRIPNGLGFCYWGNEWVSFNGPEATNGSPWENQAFWDFNNRALPVLEVYQD